VYRLPSSLALIAILASPLASPAAATTYVIRPDGTGDFPTIQDAVNGTVDADVIELADGTFTGDGNRDIDFLGKAITIRSESGDPDACVIDCEGAPGNEHRGFYFQSGEGPGSVLEGITLANAHYSESAGGVYCFNASPTFVRCRFLNSESWYSGGGVFLSEGSPTFTDCVFSGNTAWSSGGGLYLYDSSPTFTGCTFSDNESLLSHGGAIRCNLSSPTFMDCVFSDNAADVGGGAIWCFSSSFPELVDCTLSGNSAPLGGGIGCFSSSPTLTRCILSANSASYGGAMYSGQSCPALSRCTLFGNSASSGGGIWCELDSSSQLENTIIAFGPEGEALGCDDSVNDLFLTCCDVYGNAGGDWTGCLADLFGVDGNISEDPLFCDPGSGDFRLHFGSPCAPFTPPNPECDLIGACDVGCVMTTVAEPRWDSTTWSTLKAMYR
jgi:parallel beta-helix repeat protein